MNQRNAYLIQILEKIGTPLLSAVVGKKGSEGNETKEDASTIASLLSRTVQLSIDLGRMVEIEKSSPEEIESLRVAMAGLAGPMIAGQYTQTSKVPGENDIKKLTGALEAVMTFSDNFTPSNDHVIRLENMKANGMPGDTYQINIQYIQAFVQIADVVAGFPFGQPEKKLMQDVADTINSKSKQICKEIFGDGLDANQQKLCELALVKSLADLYASCHKTEMDKLMAMQEPDANAQQNGLQSVWKNFETRAEILGLMAQNMVPGTKKDTVAPTGTPSAAPTQAAPSSASSPAEQPSATPQAQSQTSNPMAMFSKPKEGESTEKQEQPQQQAPQTQQTENPMAMFSKPKNESTPDQPPPAQPPAPPPPPQTEQQAPPPATSQSEEDKSESGNPMSFFKSPPKDSGEE